jgi:hypothetical protein
MPRPSRTLVLHAGAAAVAAVELFRAAQQPWLADVIADAPARATFALVLPAASAGASALSVALAARGGDQRRALASDLAGIAVAFATLVVLAAARQPREIVGLLLIGALAARLLPPALAVIRGAERSAGVILALSFLAFAPAALWSGAATAAQGDQPHYLLGADALAHGSVDLAPEYADPARFSALSLTPLTAADLDTHVVAAERGGRLVQGYALSALIAPGWAVAGRAGALVVMALLGALLSLQVFRLCGETIGDGVPGRTAWALTVFLAPVSTLATVIYPNILGALVLVLAYRWLRTAPVRRPALAGLAAAALLLLTPRDAIGLVVLVPAALAAGRAGAARFLLSFALGALAVVALSASLYGVPLPYAGYLAGLAAAQRLDGVPSIRPRPDIGLGGMLFDRAFGLAGVAPWAFLGLAGLAPALRGLRGALGPAVAVVGSSLAALSVYRLWEGGWAPPARYLVEVLPLWAPLVGLALRRPGRALGGLAAALAALGAAVSLLFLAIPNLELNLVDTAYVVAALDRILIVDPLGLLPSFEDASAIGPALLRCIPLVLGCVALVGVGLRRARVPA